MQPNHPKERWYRNIRLTIFLAKMYLVLVVASLVYLLVDFSGTDQSFLAVQLNEQKQENSKKVNENTDKVINGIHVETGLIYAEGFDLVRSTCTGCHSAQLVIQNRATRSGWKSMIRWMQRTQGLWKLGDNEAPILDYLATHYAPEEVGRRANIDIESIEWYVLELE